MQNAVDYSIIVPVYNGEKTIEELFVRTKAVFDKLNKSFEVVFVEDNGQDASWKIISNLHKQYAHIVKGIKLARNFGQHNALLCGFKNSSGNFVITIDDDLQIPPEEIEKLIQTYDAEEHELVYGIFQKKKHAPWRNFASFFIRSSSKSTKNAPGKGSSFKLITRDLADKLASHRQHFVFIDELLLWYTSDIGFVSVEHQSRKYARSGYSFFQLLRIYFNLVVFYTAVPLKIMTFVGFISSIISFIFAARFLIRKIFYHVPIGFTSIIVTVLFASGIILFSLGIIGEYLRRMYEVQNQKPPYSIKKTLK
jgi:glycosyltransferase involved in cell wall biosynthesis